MREPFLQPTFYMHHFVVFAPAKLELERQETGDMCNVEQLAMDKKMI